ncbi:2-isopropylmalate synthase [Oceanicella actignis]|uniref:2-isopropylmalate synthase n=1 Tax=Oceanicella actignis TaxID=1189325 RepID=A0A1M7RUR6_9RHOB|nr:2-isopropylmalate synthase [Oceanicella actignis]SET02764.1 2-isopropylmalate synthase [Oceanicella actignis]SHN50011.1 2-isopropylmalate synthase [Oceanicella actignis]
MTEQTANGAPEQERVLIFDTTLRDGEQSPGATMTLTEKLEVATLLDEMGVDIIEAGFPIASEGDFEAVREISKVVKNAVVCGLARAGAKDIDRAWEALQGARRARIHTFISTSPLHMKYKLQMEPEEVLEAIARSVSHARSLTDDVQWSPEDGTRTEHDFLCRAVETAIKAGATTINIPDTVGYTAPGESAALIRMLKERVPDIDKVVISTHCHNDLGMAVANALAAVEAGARQVECTINGLGERAGNAALEEVVMAMRVRNDIMPWRTGVDTTKIMQASRLVSRITGFPVQYNKAIVGKNAFAHESGIHQDGMLKHAGTYEIMRPEDVGLTASNLVMGKHSGRNALRAKLRELGFELGDNQLNDVFVRFKALADQKKEVYDEDLLALMTEMHSDAGSDRVKVKSLTVTCGTLRPSAVLTLEIDGEEKTTTATGDGPVDSCFKAVNQLVPNQARLQLYQVHAVTEGTDAQATVSVRIEEDGRIASGQSADTDTILASTRAYVHALNRLMVRREKRAPDAVAKGA